MLRLRLAHSAMLPAPAAEYVYLASRAVQLSSADARCTITAQQALLHVVAQAWV